MKNYLTAQDLMPILDKVVLIDVRRGDKDQESGQDAYLSNHVDGAYYLDLEADLSGPVTPVSGAHPLPPLADLREKLRLMGARQDSQFVVYDEGYQFVAARAWFVLKYFGIDSVKIIKGGYPALVAAGVPLSSGWPAQKEGNIQLTAQDQLVVDFATVKDLVDQGIDQSHVVLVDARAKDRYLGINEPLYQVGGHIPGAQSYYYQDLMTETYDLKSKDQLTAILGDLMDKDLILSCGSGVTAALVMIALDELGKTAKLYPGSYSEWIKRGQRVERQDEA
ncbi:TPA: sulfurtransferase [Streptococcus suis]